MTTKTKEKPAVETPKMEKVEQEKKYEYVISQEHLEELDTFFMNSLSSRRAGVLDADRAFTKTIDMLRSALVRREVK